jgi:hypothetical protein
VSDLQRRLEPFRELLLWIEAELNLLADFLFEGGDDLPDRLVLLGVEPLLPPHHEVGGLSTERRKNERRGKKSGLLVHGSS